MIFLDLTDSWCCALININFAHIVLYFVFLFKLPSYKMVFERDVKVMDSSAVRPPPWFTRVC